MSAPAWGLAGRSGGAAEAAAGQGSEAEQELMRYIGEAEKTANSEVGGGTVYKRLQTEGVTPEAEAGGENNGSRPGFADGLSEVPGSGAGGRAAEERRGGAAGAASGWSGCSA